MKLNFETLVIFVQSIERLKTFYVDILQLEIIEEFGSEWLLLKAGNCNIGLHKIGEQYAGDSQETFKIDNNTKIIFEIDEDIKQLREHFISQNVFLKEIQTFEGYNFLLCDGEDPEGNVFQLKQKK